jgi:hypothetical protein
MLPVVYDVDCLHEAALWSDLKNLRICRINMYLSTTLLAAGDLYSTV